MKIAIIMLNWNGSKDTIEAVQSLTKYCTSYQLFLLDNGSEKQSVLDVEKYLSNVEDVRVLTQEEFEKNDIFNEKIVFIKGNENLGFAKGNNYIAKKIYRNYDYTMLLNNDTVFIENSIAKMCDYLDNNKQVGALTCDIRYFYDNQKLWNAGGKFTFYGDRKYIPQKKIDKCRKESIRVEFITGCALILRKETIEKIGLLTEDFFFGEEDFNYCLKLKRAHIIVHTLLTTRILHKVGSSISRGKQNNLYKYIIHFSNRIINMKSFYTSVRWNLWRVFYLFLIRIKLMLIERNTKNVRKVIKAIKYYTKNYKGIDKKTFEEIKGKY